MVDEINDQSADDAQTTKRLGRPVGTTVANGAKPPVRKVPRRKKKPGCRKAKGIFCPHCGGELRGYIPKPPSKKAPQMIPARPSKDARKALVVDYFSPEEAAVLLGKTYRTVIRWIHDGKLEGRKIGGTYLVPARALLPTAGKKGETPG